MTLDEIRASIKADIEKREADLGMRQMDFQVPGYIAEWRVGVTKFILTWQESDFGEDIMLMLNRGNGWVGWGGEPEYSATIMEMVSAANISAHGTMVQFFDWLIADAHRRANFVASIEFPDPTDKLGRVKFVIQNQLTVVNNHLTTPTPPLGIAPA